MRTRSFLVVPLLAGLVFLGKHAVSSSATASTNAARANAATSPAPPFAATAKPPALALALEGGPKLAELLAPLDPTAGELSNDAVSRTYFALVDELRRNSGFAAELEERLATEDPSTPAARAMVGALAGAGTPEAQDALVHLLDRRSTDDSFLRLLIPSMGFAKSPSDALVLALQRFSAGEASPTSRGTADLALGIVAGRTDDHAVADRITASYAARLVNASTEQDAAAALSVLGNAATPSAARAVSPYLSDPRPAVRAEAVDALRRVDTPEVEAAILRALVDRDEGVRTAAAEALASRPLSERVLVALIRALSGEMSERPATAIVDDLALAAAFEATARAALEQTARTHPLESVRVRAHDAYSQLAQVP